ncbi:MAG: DNRLRE domain-containing protein [Candidatus Margulisiibacteriota bacterium]
MKKSLGSILTIIALCLVSCILLLALGCGDSTNPSGKVVSSLSLSPTTATVETASHQTFYAIARYTDGTTGEVIPSWSVSGGIGTILTVGYAGLFTATGEGVGTVEATYSSKTATALITVTASQGANGLVSIEVSPSSESLSIYESHIFTAVGRNSTGESVAFDATWTISGDAIGILTSSGSTTTFEATGEGTAFIVCSSGEIYGTAVVTVDGYVVDITVEVDTYIDSGATTEVHGGDTTVIAGLGSSSRAYWALLRFSLAYLPSDASIESATLKIYPTTADADLQLFKLISSFSNATTWSTRPTMESYILSSSFTANQYNELTSDELTNLVSAWKTGTTTNDGIALYQPGSTTGTIVFLSLENGTNYPRLRVKYNR